MNTDDSRSVAKGLQIRDESPVLEAESSLILTPMLSAGPRASMTAVAVRLILRQNSGSHQPTPRNVQNTERLIGIAAKCVR